MKKIRLGRSGFESSRLAYGCMRIAGDGSGEARDRGKRALRAAIDAGYTLFDHADIYASGECEALFGELLAESPGLRDQLVVLTKSGIRFAGDPDPTSPGRYDFSKDYLRTCVEGSLKRLNVEQIDVLLLHRPDYLADFHAVVELFDELADSGKVAHFGVSNFSPSQVSLLQSLTSRPLIVNQVEINLHNTSAFSDGTLDQCIERRMTPQAWCPIAVLAYPAWGNTFSADDEARIRAEVDRQAGIYGVDDWLVALAWLLRHPAGISPIVGSTTPGRIVAAVRALDIDYSREDWYRLLEARNAAPVP
ncbi:MAG: aldo/keto reductase [Woeseiaceae bacterium]|nr:aldo/keto reductase [Woeseiaceae bacterium]